MNKIYNFINKLSKKELASSFPGIIYIHCQEEIDKQYELLRKLTIDHTLDGAIAWIDAIYNGTKLTYEQCIVLFLYILREHNDSTLALMDVTERKFRDKLYPTWRTLAQSLTETIVEIVFL